MHKHLNGLIAIASLAVISLCREWPWITLALLVIIACIQLGLKKFKTRELKFFLLTGLAGGAGEMIAVSQQARSYPSPNILGIPYWLFLLRGIAGIFVARTARAVKHEK